MATRTTTVPAPVTTVPAHPVPAPLPPTAPVIHTAIAHAPVVSPVQVPVLPALPVIGAPVVAPPTDRDRFNKMTLKDLKEEAKTRGIRGYSTKRKPELVEILLNAGGAVPAGGARGAPGGVPATLTIPQLKEAIKAKGGKGYSGKSKAELQAMLAGLP